MRRSQRRLSTLGAALALGGLVALAAPGILPALAQHGHGASGTAPDRPAEAGRRGVRIGMDELHRAGGVPPGWRFNWPAGDARKGREAFARLECYQCHEVKGESFPPVSPDPTRRGPALAGMGAHHPAEYFAESILDPNAVIVTGPGYTGADGLSIMPDFRDSLTLAETIDLVAYIRSLTGGDHARHDVGSPTEHERVLGDYRVRLAYGGTGGGHAHHGSHHGRHHHGGGGHGAAAAHLMVFVTDAALGQPVPYLPVSVRIHAKGTEPRVIRLSPMLGSQGFHYGADVTLPAATQKITVAIGTPALKVMPTAADRFAKGGEVSFDWGK
jgi:Cytochrome c/Fe2+ transport protein